MSININMYSKERERERGKNSEVQVEDFRVPSQKYPNPGTVRKKVRLYGELRFLHWELWTRPSLPADADTNRKDATSRSKPK